MNYNRRTRSMWEIRKDEGVLLDLTSGREVIMDALKSNLPKFEVLLD